ncbi:molybdopterin-binding protein [Paenibacillus hamazuiensis]|uniref:molybdopterin-binding protein n=1 Tax=Paenibacillus hamazuiensis TaxID=2936508 RepID=UPI00200EF217|nr:molybdopterin-binding protein [Paenibacillus hamazuiensis]
MNTESMLREVKVEDAVGMVLAHDLTQIIPGQFKGRLFKKGHVIREEDIPALLSIGKEHIYTIDLQDGVIHEDEAALRMARAIIGANIEMTEPHEGKVTLKSTIHGLAKVYKPFVDEVNEIEQVVVSTAKTNTIVKPGQALVGTRVIPLIIEESKIQRVEQLANHHKQELTLHSMLEMEHLIQVKPFRPLKVGLITTGSEVYKGRIQDKFGPVIREKLAAFGSDVIEQRFAPDESDVIVGEIRRFQDGGADMILVTGGMSVDPDDRTPGAIKGAGARVVSYGTPMLPGSMLLMGYLGKTPILGLPGCVMHDPYTSFDVLLPRICAGETIVREDITAMGYGGLLGC